VKKALVIILILALCAAGICAVVFGNQAKTKGDELAAVSAQFQQAQEDLAAKTQEVADQAAALTEAETAAQEAAAQIETLTASLTQAEAAAEALETEKTALDQTIADLQGQLDAHAEAIATMEQDEQDRVATITELQTKLTEAEEARAELEKQYNEQTTALTAAEEELAGKLALLSESQAQVAALETELDAANASLTEAQALLSESQAQVASLETELGTANASLTEAQAKLDESENIESYALLETQLAEKDAEIQALKEAGDGSERIAELEAQVAALTAAPAPNYTSATMPLYLTLPEGVQTEETEDGLLITFAEGGKLLIELEEEGVEIWMEEPVSPAQVSAIIASIAIDR